MKQSICVLIREKLALRISMFRIVYARAGCALSPKLLAIYVDDLSQDLAICNFVWYIDDQCMNHVMYVYDICLLAPSDIGRQRMLDVC